MPLIPDKKIYGKNTGRGVYRDAQKRLTFKATGPKLLSKLSKKTVGKSSPVGKPPKSPLQQQIDYINALQKRQAEDITGYQSAFADVLAGMGPQIQSAYSGAAGRIGELGKGTYDALRGLLGDAQGTAGAELNAATGNLLPEGIEADALSQYNPDKAAEIGFTLGAGLPAGSLEQQGAAFAGAAAFGPGYAQQQGLYALRASQQQAMDDIAQIKMESSARGGAAAMPKASASLSRAMGYLVDVYGQPILNKKGKPIPVSQAGAELTAYQQAQLELAQGRESRYVTQANNDLQFRTAADAREVKRLLIAGRKIDKTWSEQAGYIVLADGSIPRGANGKPIRYVVEKSGKKPSPGNSAFQKAVKYVLAARRMGKKNILPPFEIIGRPSTAEVNAYLRNVLGLSAAQAARALKAGRWPTGPNKTKVPKKDTIRGGD